jgi:hypothetical protein
MMPSLLIRHIRWENRKTGASFLGATLIVSLALAGTLQADLKSALAEPNLEKRSGLALANASAAYQNARTAYEKGDSEQVAAALTEIQESVNLADTSLKATGKDPRKSPKWFKRAEIETRSLLRKLDSFQQAMNFSDRAPLESVRSTVQQVHDDLLRGLLEGRKR